MRLVRRALTFALVVAAAGAGSARMQDPIDRIREADIKADLFTLAGDAMRGREGGTLDEMAASVWLAERAREAGLQPAGENGTYFQFFPLERFRVSPSSPVSLGGKALRMGRDAVTGSVMLASVDAPVVVAASAESLAGLDLKDRAVVVRYAPASAAPATGPGQNALRTFATGIQKAALTQGAVATVIIVPDSAKDQWERVSFPFGRGTYGLDPDGTADQRVAQRGTPLLYVRESALGGAPGSDARLVASIFTDSFTYPSVNVIA